MLPFISRAETYLYFSLCASADAFNNANNMTKTLHSNTLSALLCIAHVLPLACESDEVLELIFLPEDCDTHEKFPPNFHAHFTLNGWNNHIIQPARDAVLDYYKVCTPNSSPVQCLR